MSRAVTPQFQVEGYTSGEVETAVHEAGHAVATLKGARSVTADDGEMRLKEITLRGDGNAHELGHCAIGIAGYIHDIVIDMAGQQAARACGFPRNEWSPSFGRNGFRDKDYQMAFTAASGFFYSTWSDKEVSLLSDRDREQLYQRHRYPCPFWDDPEYRNDAIKYALRDDLRKRHRVSLRKLRPILDYGIRRARQLVRRPENLQLIKRIAVALLQAPKDVNGNRVLTGAQINQLVLGDSHQ